MNWSEYINEANLSAKIPDELINEYDLIRHEIDKVRDYYNQYIHPFSGSVFDIVGPKTIVKEPTPNYAIRKGYPRYSFRFVCLTSKRQSKYIKIKDYPKYGILESDKDTGGNYRTYDDIERFITDKITPLIIERDNKCNPLNNKLCELSNEIYNHNITQKGEWFNRYNEYLLSEEWKHKRNLIFNEDQHKCCICGTEYDLQAHHIHYNNVGNEELDDCITLCKDHHDSIHDMPFMDRRYIELNSLNERLSNVKAGIIYEIQI